MARASRVFASGGINRRKGGGCGATRAHTTPRRSWGWARAAPWCGWLAAPLRVSSRLRLRVGKIGGSVQVSSNSENISRLAFLEYKNRRKQELAQWHLVNRLVPENA